jgi:hypothetical protein
VDGVHQGEPGLEGCMIQISYHVESDNERCMMCCVIMKIDKDVSKLRPISLGMMAVYDEG